ncbi:MAG: transporter [Gammaproteobacteria bacterium]|jgi:phospholipid-binding lipoprotein MlaA|nr:transporter [Gammaproteobacteria bacterium]
MPTVNPISATSELPHPQSTPEGWMRTSHRSVAIASVMLVLAYSLVGCASLPEGSKRDPRDHIERFNRSIYKFNTALDHALLRPVARGYVKVTPRPVRTGVANFFSNLGYTKTIGNDIFQGQFRDFGSDIGRFVVNTTIGIGGVFDPASGWGLDKHDRDFGQTLGKWGLPTGTYLMLPLLGPSDVRDAFGLIPDRFMSIEGQITDPVIQASLTVTDKVNSRASLLPFDHVIDSAYDPYALLRNFWFQRRAHKVHGDSGTDDKMPGLDDHKLPDDDESPGPDESKHGDMPRQSPE